MSMTIQPQIDGQLLFYDRARQMGLNCRMEDTKEENKENKELEAINPYLKLEQSFRLSKTKEIGQIRHVAAYQDINYVVADDKKRLWVVSQKETHDCVAPPQELPYQIINIETNGYLVLVETIGNVMMYRNNGTQLTHLNTYEKRKSELLIDERQEKAKKLEKQLKKIYKQYKEATKEIGKRQEAMDIEKELKYDQYEILARLTENETFIITKTVNGEKLTIHPNYVGKKQGIQKSYPLEAGQTCLAVSQDGQFVAMASQDGRFINIYEFKNEKMERYKQLRRGSSDAVMYDITFDSDNQYIACYSSSGTIHLFDIKPTIQNQDGNRFSSPPSHPKRKNEYSMLYYFSYLGIRYFESEWSMIRLTTQYRASGRLCFAKDFTIHLFTVDGGHACFDFAGKEAQSLGQYNIQEALNNLDVYYEPTTSSSFGSTTTSPPSMTSPTLIPNVLFKRMIAPASFSPYEFQIIWPDIDPKDTISSIIKTFSTKKNEEFVALLNGCPLLPHFHSVPLMYLLEHHAIPRHQQHRYPNRKPWHVIVLIPLSYLKSPRSIAPSPPPSPSF